MKSKVRRHVSEVRRHEIQCVYSIPHCLFPKGGFIYHFPGSTSISLDFCCISAGTRRTPDEEATGMLSLDWLTVWAVSSLNCLLRCITDPSVDSQTRSQSRPPECRPSQTSAVVVDCYFFFFPEYELVQMLVDMHFEQVYEGYPDVSLRGFWTSLRSVSLRRLVYVLFGVSLWTFYVLVYMDFGHVYGS